MPFAPQTTIAQLIIFALAALAEIAGCFAFWAWLRLDKSIWYLLPGTICLISFAALLTLIDSDAAGRAYAAYGGIYIISALLWLRLAEGLVPDRGDIGGALLAVAGTIIILFGPRG